MVWFVSVRCLKEDPATMSLLQRCLDPEKTLGLVDVLYTAVFDLHSWKERKSVSEMRNTCLNVYNTALLFKTLL